MPGARAHRGQATPVSPCALTSFAFAKLQNPAKSAGRGVTERTTQICVQQMSVPREREKVLLSAPNSTKPNPKPVGEGFGFVVYFGDLNLTSGKNNKK